MGLSKLDSTHWHIEVKFCLYSYAFVVVFGPLSTFLRHCVNVYKWLSSVQGLKRTEQNALVELLKTKMITHSGPTAASALPELKEDKEKDDTPVQPPPTHEQMDAGATAPASSGNISSLSLRLYQHN